MPSSVLIFLFLVLVLGLLLTVSSGSSKTVTNNSGSNKFPEISQLHDKQSFKELEDFFVSVSRLRGAEYAYNLLAVAPIPPGTDLHLLGHVVGNELYKQQGAKGIELCTDQFRNACSHSIVIGLFSDKGESALPQIAQACKQAPGGKGAYDMCFHGLGHGILSALGYDLPKGIDTCQKLGSVAAQSRETVECIGGMVMEIVGGGDHDKNVWSVQREKYLLKSDPLSPCNQSYIPEIGREQCLNYLTPRFFELAGSDLANPGDDIFKKSFPYCDQLAQDDNPGRFACFGGFGKEFVVLAQKRDIRKIDQIQISQIRQIFSWCNLAPDNRGAAACLDTALSSIYWGGENNYHTAINFCSESVDDRYKEHCINNLIGMVSYYQSDKNYRSEFCNALTGDFKKTCQHLLVDYK